MMVWCALIACLIFIKLALGELNTKGKRKAYLTLAGGCCVLVLGLCGYENDYATDVAVYQRLFTQVAGADWEDIFQVNTRLEPGYILFNKLLSCISEDPQIIVFAEALISVVCACVFIYDSTDLVFESFFFYVTLGSMTFAMTAFRQTFAISLCLLSLCALRRKRPIPFVLLVLLATTFHRTALIFLCAYPLCRLPVLRRHRLLLIPGILLVVAASPLIIQLGYRLLGPEDYAIPGEQVLSVNGLVPIILYAVSVVADLVGDRQADPGAGESGTEQLPRPDLDQTTILTAAGLGLYFLRFYQMVLERAAFYFTPCSVVGLARLTARLRNMAYGLLAKMLILALCVVLFLHRISGMVAADYTFFWNLR